jgi:hypothetical protein
MSHSEIGGDKWIYQHLSGRAARPLRKTWFPILRLIGTWGEYHSHDVAIAAMFEPFQVEP